MSLSRHIPAFTTALAALTALVLAGCGSERGPDPGSSGISPVAPPASSVGGFGRIVVANRGSGTISVLEASDGALVDHFALPAAPNPPEPMYVVYIRRTDAVLVGDRANSRVVEFDARDFSVRRTAPTGAGVFHMWADPGANTQLWVNNDIDNTATVIDPVSFQVLATVPMPTDLVAAGAKPHDVVVDPGGRAAYVTMLTPMANDVVLRFDTATFTETARASVGKDPHVSLARRGEQLFVPCQNTNVVEVLDRRTLASLAILTVPGAHGAGMTNSGRTFYTANLTGGGADALFAIDTRSNTLVGSPVDAPFPTPHNIALTANGLRLFLTHSGMVADQVSFYSVSAADPVPVLLGSATVGLNPFGIAFAP